MKIERAKGNVASKLKSIEFNLDVLEDYKRIIMKFNKLHSFLFVALLPIAFSLILPTWSIAVDNENDSVSSAIVEQFGALNEEELVRVLSFRSEFGPDLGNQEKGVESLVDASDAIKGTRVDIHYIRNIPCIHHMCYVGARLDESEQFDIKKLILNSDSLSEGSQRKLRKLVVMQRITKVFQELMLELQSIYPQSLLTLSVGPDKEETMEFYKNICLSKPVKYEDAGINRKRDSVVPAVQNKEIRGRKRKRGE